MLPAWHRATVVREHLRWRALRLCFPVLYRQLLRLLPVAMVTLLQQPWWWDDHILLGGKKCTALQTKQRSKKRIKKTASLHPNAKFGQTRGRRANVAFKSSDNWTKSIIRNAVLRVAFTGTGILLTLSCLGIFLACHLCKMEDWKWEFWRTEVLQEKRWEEMNHTCCELLDMRLLRLSLQSLPTHYLQQPTAVQQAKTDWLQTDEALGVWVYKKKRIE